ncbi:MAG: hypothetical protein BZY67_03075 [SAR202 cluster bacterium Io17-Chloro-G1]|nr:MAG: hypothetical protein BZY67_03075 [SAR202 cluster bacterium Io17-Chloro-G1]
MSRSKFILLLALLTLLAVPVAVEAQTPTQPVLTSAGSLAGTGTAVIWDDQSLSDSITTSMAGVTPPAEGTAYEGWLVSDDGEAEMSVGIMSVANDGSISHTFGSASEGYTGENLIAGFNTFVITVESVPDDDPGASSNVAFGYSVPLDGIAHVRHLLSDWPSGSGVGIMTNLKAQLDIAINYAELAAASDTIEDVHSQMHLVVNVIEGAEGANYDASLSDSGDGIGVIAYAQDSKHGSLAATAVPDDTVIGEHALLVEASGANVENWANEARDIALTVIGTSNLELAKIFVGPGGRTVVSTLIAARNGFDADGDGTVGSGASEGGANQAYVEAQLMATYTLAPGTPVQVVPTPAPEPTAVPTPAPEPTAVPTPVPAALQPTAPGLPGVGDDSVPIVAQLALLAAVVLLGTGGIFMVRGRRSKKSI